MTKVRRSRKSGRKAGETTMRESVSVKVTEREGVRAGSLKFARPLVRIICSRISTYYGAILRDISMCALFDMSGV